MEVTKSIAITDKSPSSSSSKEAGTSVIDVGSSSCSSAHSISGGTPLRSIRILKKKLDMDAFDDSEDCVILDFDPSDEVDFLKLQISGTGRDSDDDISVIAERGKVACRDYPHSRHLCVKFPFQDTPHDSYCELCYCFVCDSSAPCKYWNDPWPGHCHANADRGDWEEKRRIRNKVHKPRLLSTGDNFHS